VPELQCAVHAVCVGSLSGGVCLCQVPLLAVLLQCCCWFAYCQRTALLVSVAASYSVLSDRPNLCHSAVQWLARRAEHVSCLRSNLNRCYASCDFLLPGQPCIQWDGPNSTECCRSTGASATQQPQSQTSVVHAAKCSIYYLLSKFISSGGPQQALWTALRAADRRISPPYRLPQLFMLKVLLHAASCPNKQYNLKYI
jgi:hypothetical protein